MQSRQAEAILLEVTDLQEADRIVTFLTREQGKKRGVARGAKRKFSRFAGELQPMAKARIGWFEKEGRELVRISSVELLRPTKRLHAALEGILHSAYLGESVATFTPENEPADKVYRLLDAVLEALEGGAVAALVLRYFESWLLRLAGIFPPPDECPHCGRPLGPGGASAALAGSGEALLCRACAGENVGALPVSVAALEFWRRIGRENLAQMSERPPAASTLAEVEEVAGRIRRHFLQGEIRSYQVLKRTLSRLSDLAGAEDAEIR
jgi:DNA repair protein RecO (recombination protein O)